MKTQYGTFIRTSCIDSLEVAKSETGEAYEVLARCHSADLLILCDTPTKEDAIERLLDLVEKLSIQILVFNSELEPIEGEEWDE